MNQTYDCQSRPELFDKIVETRDTLNPDPEQHSNYPNTTPRPVKDGHYVIVKPTPLPDPELVHYSTDVASSLGLSDEQMRSNMMVRYLSGDVNAVCMVIDTVAMPYALSIYGTEYRDNCPYKNDTGYGDGRAISVGTFKVNGRIHELQLKGAGRTPFARSGDGRSDLRSSIREYLASEAMHYLGVPTTRSLSIVRSNTEVITRHSYKQDDGSMYKNNATIMCRVAGSFYRIGHLELFSRRTRREDNKKELRDLELLLRHIIRRDYDYVYDEDLSMDDQIVIFLKEVSKRFCKMVAGWMSVGYIQSNMNSDNCAISGITLDYGPFGFMDRYDRKKNFWTGGGEHFSYYNQPTATRVNFITLCKSLQPLLTNDGVARVNGLIKRFHKDCTDRVRDIYRRKLGFKKVTWSEGVGDLFSRLDDLLQESHMDWTMFWRELSWYPMLIPGKRFCEDHDISKASYAKDLLETHREEWMKWIGDWFKLLGKEGIEFEDISTQMLNTNPKYIPREWMLNRAYKDVLKGDYSTLNELSMLFMDPYSDKLNKTDRWYQLTPPELLNKPGICSMTCSS